MYQTCGGVRRHTSVSNTCQCSTSTSCYYTQLIVFKNYYWRRNANLNATAKMKVSAATVLSMEERKVGEVYFKLAKYKLRDKQNLKEFWKLNKLCFHIHIQCNSIIFLFLPERWKEKNFHKKIKGQLWSYTSARKTTSTIVIMSVITTSKPEFING